MIEYTKPEIQVAAAKALDRLAACLLDLGQGHHLRGNEQIFALACQNQKKNKTSLGKPQLEGSTDFTIIAVVLSQIQRAMTWR